MQSAVPPSHEPYDHCTYWHEQQQVGQYLSQNIPGAKNRWWTTDLLKRFCDQPFHPALVINCGNGWVEREIRDQGIVRKGTAFGYSMDLLETAQQEKGQRPISYFRADVNTISLPQNHFDLIVNVAALHYVPY